MALISPPSVRQRFFTIGRSCFKHLYRLRRALIVGVLLLALVLLGPASHFADAEGGTWREFNYDGPTGSRPYFVYTPGNYHVGTAVPLLVMLHGCTQTAADFAAGTQMNELADTHQFLVVYPQQLPSANPTMCWNWPEPANQVRGSGEPAILAGIVQAVEANTALWTIDSSRVFVAGASAGAVMSVILGATYPDLFAAIGVVAGTQYPAATSDPSTLDPLKDGEMVYQQMGHYARVVPTIAFQGTADTVVAPENGDLVIRQWMQTDSMASHGNYAASFDNPAYTHTSSPPDSHPYIERGWNDAAGHEVQQYWMLVGAGHAWTGGSPAGTFTDPLGPDISSLLYDFFMKHPMSESPALS